MNRHLRRSEDPAALCGALATPDDIRVKLRDHRGESVYVLETDIPEGQEVCRRCRRRGQVFSRDPAELEPPALTADETVVSREDLGRLVTQTERAVTLSMTLQRVATTRSAEVRILNAAAVRILGAVREAVGILDAATMGSRGRAIREALAVLKPIVATADAATAQTTPGPQPPPVATNAEVTS